MKFSQSPRVFGAGRDRGVQKHDIIKQQVLLDLVLYEIVMRVLTGHACLSFLKKSHKKFCRCKIILAMLM
jgi:hypothetical protein